MQWTDQAIILSLKNFSEHQKIVSCLTATNGRQTGMWSVPKRHGVSLDIGDRVDVTWKARLEGHLGTFTIEKRLGYPLLLFLLPTKLWVLHYLAHLLELLPLKHSYPVIFEAVVAFVGELEPNDYQKVLLELTFLELLLLRELGFGLSLQQCCVTGVRQGLCYISPKTGRAVSEQAAGPYVAALLPFPKFWAMSHDTVNANIVETQAALRVTFYFIDKWLLSEKAVSMREMLVKLREQFVRAA